MIPIIPAIIATKSGLDILQKAKEWFYPSKTISEAETILGRRIADDVGSLQEQVRVHRQVIDKLVEQLKTDKDMLEKHNEVLIQLSEAAQQLAAAQAKTMMGVRWAVGLGGAALLAAVFVLLRK